MNFCHQAAMDCQVCQRISPEMVSAIRDLPGISNNVNQIAHQMHTYGLEAVKPNNAFQSYQKSVESSPK